MKRWGFDNMSDGHRGMGMPMETHVPEELLHDESDGEIVESDKDTDKD